MTHRPNPPDNYPDPPAPPDGYEFFEATQQKCSVDLLQFMKIIDDKDKNPTFDELVNKIEGFQVEGPEVSSSYLSILKDYIILSKSKSDFLIYNHHHSRTFVEDVLKSMSLLYNKCICLWEYNKEKQFFAEQKPAGWTAEDYCTTALNANVMNVFLYRVRKNKKRQRSQLNKRIKIINILQLTSTGILKANKKTLSLVLKLRHIRPIGANSSASHLTLAPPESTETPCSSDKQDLKYYTDDIFVHRDTIYGFVETSVSSLGLPSFYECLSMSSDISMSSNISKKLSLSDLKLKDIANNANYSLLDSRAGLIYSEFYRELYGDRKYAAAKSILKYNQNIDKYSKEKNDAQKQIRKHRIHAINNGDLLHNKIVKIVNEQKVEYIKKGTDITAFEVFHCANIHKKCIFIRTTSRLKNRVNVIWTKSDPKERADSSKCNMLTLVPTCPRYNEENTIYLRKIICRGGAALYSLLTPTPNLLKPPHTFVSVHEMSVVNASAMIGAYSNDKNFSEAIQLYKKWFMRADRVWIGVTSKNLAGIVIANESSIDRKWDLYSFIDDDALQCYPMFIKYVDCSARKYGLCELLWKNINKKPQIKNLKGSDYIQHHTENTAFLKFMKGDELNSTTINNILKNK